jgi:hypothetical protein
MLKDEIFIKVIAKYINHIFSTYKINIHNNMSCLKPFNNFIKKSNFEFGHYCICNENKFIHELIICDISNLDSKLK